MDSSSSLCFSQVKVQPLSTEESFQQFLHPSSTSKVMVVTGATGSGKTRGVLNFFTKRRDISSVFLLPRKSVLSVPGWATHVHLSSLTYFVHHFVMNRKYPKMDVLIIDEFHVENTEWKVLLQALSQKWVPWKKLVVISATFSDYHYHLMNEYFGVENMQNVKSVNFERADFRAYTTDIQYLSDLQWFTASDEKENINQKNQNNQKNQKIQKNKKNMTPHRWSFSNYKFIFPESMYRIILHILKQFHLKKNRKAKRVLVFLPSPDMCEQIADFLLFRQEKEERMDVLNYSTVTVHGQKTTEEIEEIVKKTKQPQHSELILSTNLLETSVTLSDLELVIDFGICYAPDAHGQVTQRYCTQSEMIQRSGRTGRVCDGMVYRIMSLQFFEEAPYALPHKTEWGQFLLTCSMQRFHLPSLLAIFESEGEEGREDKQDIREELERLTQLNLLDKIPDRLNSSKFEFRLSSLFPKENMYRLLQSPFKIDSFPFILSSIQSIQYCQRCRVIQNLNYFLIIQWTLVIALMDVIRRFGIYRFFYIPRIENCSYRHLLRCWHRYLDQIQEEAKRKCREHRFEPMEEDEKWIWKMMELVWTLILYPSSMQEMQVNGRIWNQFLLRWKILLGPSFFNVFNPPAHSKKKEFVVHLQEFYLQQSMYLEDVAWSFGSRTLYNQHDLISQVVAMKQHQCQKIRIYQGQWVILSDVGKEEMRKLFWSFAFSSVPTLNTQVTPNCILHASSYGTFGTFGTFDPYVIPLKPKIYLYEEEEVCIYCPKYITEHYRELSSTIYTQFQKLESFQTEKEQWKLEMNHVVQEIDQEVAFWIGKYKFLECQEHFYHYAQAQTL